MGEFTKSSCSRCGDAVAGAGGSGAEAECLRLVAGGL
jgi:hypothetical protein